LNVIRTIRQEPKFDEQLEGLGVSCKRLDAILEGVGFALARAPEAFERVPGTLVSILKTAVHPGAPSVRIFFTYNEHEVHLLMIEFCEDDVRPFLLYEE
jgi:hypothetical protein